MLKLYVHSTRASAPHRIAIAFHIENDWPHANEKQSEKNPYEGEMETIFSGVRAKIGLTAAEVAQFSGVSFIPITKYANKIQ